MARKGYFRNVHLPDYFQFVFWMTFLTSRNFVNIYTFNSFYETRHEKRCLKDV